MNFARILDELTANYGLVDGPDVQILLTGDSAGGVGAFTNVDFLASRYPSSVVKAAPNAGYFFPGDPLSPPTGNGIPLDYADWAAGPPYNNPHNDTVTLLWQAQLDPTCVQHYNATLGPAFTYFCGSVSNLYPFIVSPVFTIENMYDSNQIFKQMGTPNPAVLPRSKEYIARYGALMRNSTMQISHNTAKPGDGIFLASCLAHGMGRTTTLKASDRRLVGFREVLADWFFGQGKFASHRLVDGCSSADGLPCNPTCDHAGTLPEDVLGIW